MDWNSKWDWFGSKATNITKKPQLMDWKIIDDGGWFNLSAVSSTKSSMSASTISSIKNGMPTPYFELPSVEGFSGNLGTKMEIQRTEVPETAEPLIGLKLGKRTYFESNVSVMPTPPTNLLKRTKSTSQNIPTPRCVVQDCSADLSMGKEYHRKHRICESHSKCPKVIVGGFERRFCQQCSRFHSLSEFDEKKRSCRKRLSDHNARRRKPPRETIQCSSARLSSPFDGERHQLNYLPNYSPLVCSRSSADTAWDTKHKSKFTLPKGYYSKSNINMHTNERLLASMSSIPQMFIPGSKGPPISSPEYSRALSLLSNGEPQNTSLLYQRIPIGVPLSSPDFWLRPPVSDNNFQETPLLVTPFEADLFSNILN